MAEGRVCERQAPSTGSTDGSVISSAGYSGREQDARNTLVLVADAGRSYPF